MFTHDDSKLVRLSPFETVAMTLLDGRTRLDEVSGLLSEMLTIDKPEADQVINNLLKRNEELGPFLEAISDSKGKFTRLNTPRILRELTAYNSVPNKALRLQVPLSLVLLPTYHCQTECIYCYAERPNLPLDAQMRPARWAEILMEAGELGIDLVTFSGGDPLTYKGIDLLLMVASAYKMNYILPTKTLVTAKRAEELAKVLSDKGQVQISVDSFDPYVADLLTGSQNYVEKAKASIRNLRGAGLQVRTNTVVTSLNISGVENLIRELHHLGVSRAQITNYYRSHYRHNDDLFLSNEQIDNLNKLVMQLKDELKWPGLACNANSRDFSLTGSNSEKAWKGRASCSGGFSSCVILPNGDVVLCEKVPHDHRFVVGNVAHQSLLDVWNSKEMMDFIVPEQHLFAGTACVDCNEFNCCHRLYGRCFRDAYFNYGRIYAPSPNCPRASPGIRMS